MRRALQEVDGPWLLLQQTAAAVLAWLIGTTVIGHDEPFFAPVAAIAALNATLGERGVNAVKMLLGVAVGIAVAELTIVAFGPGYGRLALATFAAMAVAQLLHASRVVVAQAAASAILTVVALDGAAAGLDRLIDAAVGGGVALVFSQVLFTPEPIRLLRRAERAGLAAVAEILARTARVLERDDPALLERALDLTQEVRAELLEVERTRLASRRVRRHAVFWRSRARGVALEAECERARRLDLLGASCLMLVRSARSAPPDERRALAPGLRELAAAVAELTGTLDAPGVRQHAATRALALARSLFRGGQHQPSMLAVSTTLLEVVAVDFIAFAGVERADVVAAVTGGAGELAWDR